MSSEETHSAFGEFVDAWNGRRLSQDYYQGGMTVTTVARTSYNWGIRPETSAADRIEREREE